MKSWSPSKDLNVRRLIYTRLDEESEESAAQTRVPGDLLGRSPVARVPHALGAAVPRGSRAPARPRLADRAPLHGLAGTARRLHAAPEGPAVAGPGNPLYARVTPLVPPLPGQD